MIIFARERNRPDAEQCFGASGICVGKCGGTQLVAVGKHNEDRGIGKELQSALHDCLEHGLRVTGRTADQFENFSSRSLLVQRLVALAFKQRNLLTQISRRSAMTDDLRRIAALQRLRTLPFSFRFVAPPHCPPPKASDRPWYRIK